MTQAATRPSIFPPRNIVLAPSPTKRPSVAIDAPRVDLVGLHSRYVNPGELEVLIHLIGSRDARVVIEIGANSGRTAKAVLRNVPTVERYIGVDVPVGYVPALAAQRQEVPTAPGHLAMDDGRFRLLVSGRGSLDLEPRDLPQCDAMFIDGDHSRRAVLHDTYLARNLVKPGGVIIWHDDHGRDVVDVSAVLDELHDGGAHIFHVEGTWIAFEIVR